MKGVSRFWRYQKNPCWSCSTLFRLSVWQKTPSHHSCCSSWACPAGSALDRWKSPKLGAFGGCLRTTPPQTHVVESNSGNPTWLKKTHQSLAMETWENHHRTRKTLDFFQQSPLMTPEARLESIKDHQIVKRMPSRWENRPLIRAGSWSMAHRYP